MQPVYLSSVYPTPNRPYHGVFVQDLIKRVQALWEEDGQVIFPAPVSDLRNGFKLAGERVITLPNGNKLFQHFPLYLSVSSKFLSSRNAAHVTVNFFAHAVEHVYRRHLLNADAFYGHFLLPGGVTSVRMGRIFNKPSFITLDESSYTGAKKAFLPDELREMVRGVSGVLSVSIPNADFMHNELHVPRENIVVLPNAADTDEFKPYDRAEMRRKYKLPEDEVLVAFVGAYIDRKGPDRVIEALKGLDNVGVLLIGDGAMQLESDQIRWKARIDHDELPQLLSAADMFMLPTLAEGSCNAVTEALACGLPVISSDLPFNHLIVDDDRGILVDPTDIKALHDAAAALANDTPKREQMSRTARRWSEENSLAARAVKMKAFMEAKAEEFYDRR
ncbi:glycosyltransferase [bacterium]|nr:glycosyltransferase [bacterium]